jgi:hypothetical protein
LNYNWLRVKDLLSGKSEDVVLFIAEFKLLKAGLRQNGQSDH